MYFRILFINIVGMLLLLGSGTVLSENISAGASKGSLEKVRVQFKWFHQFRFAGYYAALEQGYYAAEGLDVEFLERQMHKSVVDQVLSGDVNYGVGDSSLLPEFALGKPIVALAAIFQHNPLVFLSRAETGIIRPENIKGNRLSYDANNVLELPLKALLAKFSVTESDYLPVKQAEDYRALTNRSVDVVAGYLTSQPYYYQQVGIRVNVLNPKDFGLDFYGDMLFTSAIERQQNPERVLRFVKATLKGWEYALAHPDELINLIAHRYHSKLSIPQLKFEADAIRLLVDQTIPLGYLDVERLKNLATIYAQFNQIPALDDNKLKQFVFAPLLNNSDNVKPEPQVKLKNNLKESTENLHNLRHTQSDYFVILLMWFGVIGLISLCVYYLRREIYARLKVERREQRRNIIANMVSDHEPLTVILKSIVADIERFDSAIGCSILLLTEDKKSIKHCITAKLPNNHSLSAEGSSIGDHCCPCCDTAFTGQAVIVENIQRNKLWRTNKGHEYNLPYKACWSQAIYSKNQELLGSFTIYHNNLKKTSKHFKDLIDESVVLVANAINKSHIDTQMQLSASLFSHAREGIYVTDETGSIVDCNEAFLKISGYSRTELIGKNPRIFKSGVHDKAYYEQMWRSLLEKGFWSGEIWNKYKNRDNSPGLHSITAIRNQHNELERFLVQVTDISELKQQQLALEQFAYNDVLTGLPNRLLLIDRLNQSLLKNQRDGHNLAVIFIDLDGFKLINDNYGHGVGDQFLVAMSQQMQAVIRETDTIARIGGDEFIVVLNSLDTVDSCKKPILSLLNACNKAIEIGGHTLKVSASLGIRFYRGEFDNELLDAETLIHQADQAMYVAKKSGKNRYHHYDNTADQVINIPESTFDAIQNGLAQGEFDLNYQPKVNMYSGELLGVEALIYWNHPRDGCLLSDDFLPLIENHPLAIDLGEWLIQQVLQQQSKWQTAGLFIPVSVNINARHFSQHNFFERLKNVLGCYPEYRTGGLELEVLEETIIADYDYARKLMQDCQKLGVSFALDQFGIGCSSLNYLRQLVFNSIKIDRSFIDVMDKGPDNHAVINSLIGLLSTVGSRIIAEGVEKLEQGEMLLNMGCELAQGNAFGKPMSPEQFSIWRGLWKNQVQKNNGG